MYVPSYLLAAVRAAELNTYMKNRFGDKWWKEQESCKVPRGIMRSGASIDLSIFSNLYGSIFVKEITAQESFSLNLSGKFYSHVRVTISSHTEPTQSVGTLNFKLL